MRLKCDGQDSLCSSFWFIVSLPVCTRTLACWRMATGLFQKSTCDSMMLLVYKCDVKKSANRTNVYCISSMVRRCCIHKVVCITSMSPLYTRRRPSLTILNHPKLPLLTVTLIQKQLHYRDFGVEVQVFGDVSVPSGLISYGVRKMPAQRGSWGKRCPMLK